MNNCWCGSFNTIPWFNGTYDSPETKTTAEIVRCECGQVYTKSWRLLEHKKDSIESAPLESIRASLRHQNSKNIVDTFMNGGKMLEVGCGSGASLQYMGESEKFISCVGIDKKKLWTSSTDGKFSFRQCEIQNEMGVYDDVVIVHCLEHIEQVADFLGSLRKNVHDGSKVYICVPNNEAYRFYTSMTPVGLCCAFGAFAPQEHCWHFDPQSLLRLISTCISGMRVVYLNTSAIWSPGEQIDLVIEI